MHTLNDYDLREKIREAAFPFGWHYKTTLYEKLSIAFVELL